MLHTQTHARTNTQRFDEMKFNGSEKNKHGAGENSACVKAKTEYVVYRVSGYISSLVAESDLKQCISVLLLCWEVVVVVVGWLEIFCTLRFSLVSLLGSSISFPSTFILFFFFRFIHSNQKQEQKIFVLYLCESMLLHIIIIIYVC